jgi:hypothetical protein
MSSFPPPKPPSITTQTVNGHKRLSPEEGFAELERLKKNGRMACWSCMEPMIVPIDPNDLSKGMQVVLLCLECDKHLQPSNVHNLAKSHFNSDGKCKTGPKLDLF